MSKWSLLCTANHLSAVRVIAGKIISLSTVRPDENCSGRIRSNVRLSFAYRESTRQHWRSTRGTFRSQTRVRDRRVSDSAELWAYSEAHPTGNLTLALSPPEPGVSEEKISRSE